MICAVIRYARRLWAATDPSTPFAGEDPPPPQPQHDQAAGAGTPLFGCPHCGDVLICCEEYLEL